jgi:hypothetical protein
MKIRVYCYPSLIPMEVPMLRKIVIATTLGLFLATSVVTPASAATIKTGAACSKDGATKKVGKKVYVCGNNQFVTPAKKTWALKTCLDGYESYLSIKDDLIPQAMDMLDLLSGADKITQQAEIDKMSADNVLVFNALKTRWCKRGA